MHKALQNFLTKSLILLLIGVGIFTLIKGVALIDQETELKVEEKLIHEPVLTISAAKHGNHNEIPVIERDWIEDEEESEASKSNTVNHQGKSTTGKRNYLLAARVFSPTYQLSHPQTLSSKKHLLFQVLRL